MSSKVRVCVCSKVRVCVQSSVCVCAFKTVCACVAGVKRGVAHAEVDLVPVALCRVAADRRCS